jgi:hypothetical protein
MMIASTAVAVALRPTMVRIESHNLGGRFEVASAALGLWLIGIVVVWSRRRGRLDLFELPTWISINSYIQVILNVWLFQRDYQFLAPWLYASYETISVAVVALFGLGLSCMWLGYAWSYAFLTRRPQFTKTFTGTLRLRLTFLIWFGTWFISTFSVIVGWQGYLAVQAGFRWENYLSFIQLIGTAAATALALHHFRHPSRWSRIWLGLYLGSSVLFALIIGTKGAVLLFIWLIMTEYYATRRVRWRWMAIGGLVAIFLIPSVNLIRAGLHATDVGQGVAFSQRLGVVRSATQELTSRSVSELYSDTRETFEGRQSGVMAVTASALFLHPRLEHYVAGETAEYMLQQLIPRLVWPDKPTQRSDLFMITTSYLGAATEYSFSDIGLFADSYRIGGWLFVVLCFISIGAVGAWLYWRGPESANTVGIVFYTVVLSDIVRYSDPVSLVILRLLQMGVLLWFLLRFVFFSAERADSSHYKLGIVS